MDEKGSAEVRARNTLPGAPRNGAQSRPLTRSPGSRGRGCGQLREALILAPAHTSAPTPGRTPTPTWALTPTPHSGPSPGPLPSPEP